MIYPEHIVGEMDGSQIKSKLNYELSLRIVTHWNVTDNITLVYLTSFTASIKAALLCLFNIPGAMKLVGKEGGVGLVSMIHIP